MKPTVDELAFRIEQLDADDRHFLAMLMMTRLRRRMGGRRMGDSWRAAFAEFLRVCSLYTTSCDDTASAPWWVGLTRWSCWPRPGASRPPILMTTPTMREGHSEFFTPAEARRLATVLLAAADEAERKEGE